MHFLGDILHILGGFQGKFCLFGGVILVQDLGRIKIRLPGTEALYFVVEYTPMQH